jgi:tRNA (guanine10-N2)-dimethyltransferase
MRSLILIGSGWHPPLFRAEVSSLLGPIETLHPRIAFVTQSEEALDRLSGASLVDEALHSSSRLWPYGQALSEGELASLISEWAEDFLPSGTFAVRSRRLGTGVDGVSGRKLEAEAGSLIADESRAVDLENPDNEIVVVLAGPEDASSYWDDAQSGQLVIWGLSDRSVRGTYSAPSPTERPFFKPVTLDPRLARLMVSLSRSRGEPTAVVDPFCGTGGIAIEASMLGFEVLASDLDPEMVRGTVKNLEWANGTGSSRAEVHPADSVHELWGGMTGCSFVFDPPYGRNAWASDDGLDVLLGALAAARLMSPDGMVCTMLPTIPEALGGPISDQLQVLGREWGQLKAVIRDSGWEVSMCAPVRVHRSLSRLVVVCHPAD